MPRWVGGFATEDDAKAARDEARVKGRRGEYIDRSSITVADAGTESHCPWPRSCTPTPSSDAPSWPSLDGNGWMPSSTSRPAPGTPDPAITLRVYAHVVRSAETAVANVFAKVIKAAYEPLLANALAKGPFR